MEFKEEKDRFAVYDDGKEIGEMTWSPACLLYTS